jgi:hypothetical protein
LGTTFQFPLVTVSFVGDAVTLLLLRTMKPSELNCIVDHIGLRRKSDDLGLGIHASHRKDAVADVNPLARIPPFLLCGPLPLSIT